VMLLADRETEDKLTDKYRPFRFTAKRTLSATARSSLSFCTCGRHCLCCGSALQRLADLPQV
jgi:hypothetical protein